MHTMNKRIVCILVLLRFCDGHKTFRKDFPKNFLLGTASSAYQVEGAWNADGKGENIWDYFTHNFPEKIIDGTNGDIACDSYHKIGDDITILNELGVNHYRFSLSWSRILPTGFPDRINQAGIDYYNKLINKLIVNQIKPMVTLYHWDLPQPLQALGGFLNPGIAEWFNEYARVCFEQFGDRVKIWSTFNEPRIICALGYGTADMPPGLNSSGVSDYLCGHNLLIAHASAYHLYADKFKLKQKGQVGIVLDSAWHEPASRSWEDIAAAERQNQFFSGWFSNPIFSKLGDYPPVMKQFVANRSREEGYSQSRLPKFSLNEIRSIRGTSDYYGLNFYTSHLTANKKYPIGDPSIEKDAQVQTWQDPSWPAGASDPFRSTPWGFRKMLKWLNITYNGPVIYVTENGFPDAEPIHDKGRIAYITSHLEQLLESIYYDRVRIKAYTLWSIMDNFEWIGGYSIRFGLQYVNFTDPSRPRIPKDSFALYKKIIKERRLP